MKKITNIVSNIIVLERRKTKTPNNIVHPKEIRQDTIDHTENNQLRGKELVVFKTKMKNNQKRIYSIQ